MVFLPVRSTTHISIRRFRIGYRPVFAMKRQLAETHYDGINFSFRQRMATRFQLQANYTLGWAYGYGSGGGSFRNYPKLATAPFASWEWGPSPNDERHHITVAGVVDLPKGFEIAPILQYGSARAFDLTNASNTLNTGGGTAIGVVVPASDPTDWFAFAGDDTGAQNCFYGIRNGSKLHHRQIRSVAWGSILPIGCPACKEFQVR